MLHLRSNLLLLVLWIILAAFITGRLGSVLGIQFLFLDPEYLGRVSLWSFMLVGFCLGLFIMSWNLTTYLLSARYFSFLASLSRPFFKFCLNNALLPVLLLIVYLVWLCRFYAPFETLKDGWLMLQAALGLFTGLIASLLVYMVYFQLTNRDIDYFKPKRHPMPHLAPAGEGGRRTHWDGGDILRRENPFHVKTYLGDRLKTRGVRSVAHYERRLLERVFKQNHWNAIKLQFVTVIALVVLGLLADHPYFQLPAAASLLILFALVTAVIGAISYWAFYWRIVIFILMAVLVNQITSTKWFHRSNYAYGLNYDRPAAPYTEEAIFDLRRYEDADEDYHSGLEILENWLACQASPRPTMVILSASGGGLSAALWTTVVIQHLQRDTEQALLPATALMTGASGGMIGMAYMRELYHLSLSDPEKYNLLDASHQENISRDLLNPVAFSIVSNDLFLPFRKVEIGGHSYMRDRAYSFERKLNRNTNGLLDHPLAYYRQPERSGRIPQLLITPAVISDARRMTISPQPIRHLMSPPTSYGRPTQLIPDAIDFGALLGRHEADSLRFLTALRMNATYPYVLPFIQLPTKPAIQLVDAGYRDNYGVASAARFLHVYRDWIQEHTSGIILVQISVHLSDQVTLSDSHEGIIDRLLNPLGLAGGAIEIQDLEQENMLGLLADLYEPDHFRIVRFPYEPSPKNGIKETISFHMTAQERANILAAIQQQEHQESIDYIRSLIQE